MGKEKKRKRSKEISEVEEREKVKESILKVFRARLEQSPSQGGAIVVGESKKPVQCNDSSSSDNMSGRSKTKRKTSSQKKKGKRNSPDCTDTAVNKHLKVAHGIVYKHGKDKEERAPVYRPGASRLTQKVGIFNLGKKSKPATRGMFVPDHIQLQTEADIKKIVQEANIENHLSVDMNISDSIQKSVEVSSAKLESSGSLSVRRTPSEKNNSFVASCETVTRSNGSELQSDLGLEPLDLKETLVAMMLPLGPKLKQLNPGRDYFKETLITLQKLLKQNAPRSATPTPIPVLNKIKTSGGIQRNLFGETESQKSTDILTHKSPGLSSLDLGSKNERTIPVRISDRGNPLRSTDRPKPVITDRPIPVRISDPAVHYPITHLYDKTLNMYGKVANQCTVYSCKPPHFNPEIGVSNLDMQYYRNKVLGTERRENGGYIGNSKDFIQSNCDTNSSNCDNSKHTWSYLQFSKSKPQSVYNNRERQRYSETASDLDRDCHMLTDDAFDPFFFDVSQGKNTQSLPRTLVENSRVIEDFPNHILSSPRNECSLKITKPISPLVDNDVLDMLQKNENKGTGRQNYEPMECEIDQGDALSLLKKNDIMQSINDVRKRQEEDCMCRHGRYGSQGSTESSCNSQQKVMYMPGFHSDYYVGSSVKDLLWQNQANSAKTESMDILDHVDLDFKMDTHSSINHKYTSEIKDILQTASLNTRTFSPWKTAEGIPNGTYCNQKHYSSQSDSPQLVLSPRKMY